MTVAAVHELAVGIRDAVSVQSIAGIFQETGDPPTGIRAFRVVRVRYDDREASPVVEKHLVEFALRDAHRVLAFVNR